MNCRVSGNGCLLGRMGVWGEMGSGVRGQKWKLGDSVRSELEGNGWEDSCSVGGVPQRNVCRGAIKCHKRVM